MNDGALQALGLPSSLRLPGRHPCWQLAQQALDFAVRKVHPPPGGTHRQHQQDQWLAADGRQ